MRSVFLLAALLFSEMSFAQKGSWPVYYQLSSGIANFNTNTSVNYKLHCPLAKMGLNLKKSWGRFGISPSFLLGIRFKSISNSPFLSTSSPTEEEIYIQDLNEIYSTDQVILEVPLTVYCSFVQDRLSLHSGISFKGYLNRTQGPLNENPNTKGIQSVLRFKASKKMEVSLDYYYGLGILHSVLVVSNSTEYHVKETYFQFSLLIGAF